MSVRRLAEASVQPASFAFTKANAAWAKQTIRKYPKGREQSAVIPLLMRAQEQEGWVSQAAIEHVAGMLDMPRIRVLEVATFYTQYQLAPVGTKAHVQVCGTTPCMLRGSEKLMDVCRTKIHPEQFHTNESGTLSWEEVECLGACVNAPMVMIFKDTFEDLTPEKLSDIIDAFDKGRGSSVPPGPQNGRYTSEPQTAQTTLVDERIILKSARDREAKEAGRAAEMTAGATVPPSRAARPKTNAIETSPAVRSPSAKKADANGEKRASVRAPRENKAAADRAAPEVEDDKPRAHARAKTDHSRRQPKSPELLQGQPLGPDGKRRRSEPVAPVGTPTPNGKLAAGASAAGTKAAAKPSLESRDRPAGVTRPAKPDDLQLISGVGPKIEGILHSLGIFTYAQVASWTKKEREWVDGYLSFSGRIEREDWVKQASALAKGGEAEYVRVFGKKPR